VCLTCTCGMPLEAHGDEGNLLLQRLQRAATTAGVTLAEAAWSIPRTLTIATQGGEWPPCEDTLLHRPAVVFDVDGILAFTAEALCGALNARFGTDYSPLSQQFFPGTLVTSRLPAEQAAWVSGLLREPAFLTSFAPDFHALDTLRDAYESGLRCEVVTERDPTTEDVTAAWLAGWDGPAVDVHAVGHGNKPAYLGARYGPHDIAVLVDDNPAAQLTIARDGIQVWTPERPYTPAIGRDHVREFATWHAVRYWLGLGPQA
jgi:hypothetical protein